MDFKIDKDEMEVLRIILGKIVLQDHSSMLGVLHGLDRFVSLAERLGISGGIRQIKK